MLDYKYNSTLKLIIELNDIFNNKFKSSEGVDYKLNYNSTDYVKINISQWDDEDKNSLFTDTLNGIKFFL